MQAVMYREFGEASVLQLEQVPLPPPPAAGEVQVTVRHVSLNPIDFKLRQGIMARLGLPRRPAVTGLDFAGVVAAVGRGVTDLAPGQRVFGSAAPFSGRGACAERLNIAARLVAPIPYSLSDETAACLPIACGTAWQALITHAGLHAGHTVLITGASGAVGAAAVQIAHAHDAHVHGVCHTRHLAEVRGMGAERVFDYTRDDWTRANVVYDVILDAAGVSRFGAVQHCLARNGTYIHTQPGASHVRAALWARLSSRQRCVPFFLKKDRVLLHALGLLAQEGVLRPHVDRTVGLDGVAEAQRAMAAGQVHGKVCVRI